MPLIGSPRTDVIDADIRLDSLKHHISQKRHFTNAATRAKRHNFAALAAEVRRHEAALSILHSNPDVIWVYRKDTDNV